MTRPLVDPSPEPTRFVSVDRPELGVMTLQDDDGNGDVWACDECEGAGTIDVHFEWRGCPQDGERECDECRGTGWLHGFDENDRGLPARPMENPDGPGRAAA